MAVYAPYLKNMIPAFTIEEGIKIPYTLNRANAWDDVSKFIVVVKGSAGKQVFPIDTFTVDKPDNEDDPIVLNVKALREQYKEGTYYKVQIAAVAEHKGQDDEISAYSSVAVTKCIAKPTITINGFEDDGDVHYVQPNFLAQVSYDESAVTGAVDRIAQYRFQINGVEDTDWQIHDISTDSSGYLFEDSYIPRTELSTTGAYVLTYSIKTVNGYETSAKLNFLRQPYLTPISQLKFNLQINNDEGYVDIKFDKGEPFYAGDYIVSRASEKDNYTTWNELFRFTSLGGLSTISYKDMTVEHNTNYKYAVQQVNKYNQMTERIESNVVNVRFDDMFLFDGERQLKVEYNPQVDSFKRVVLENKQETIGSKFPYFSRNGHVDYKQFPVGGLISYHMDDCFLFMSQEDQGLRESPPRTGTPDEHEYNSEYYANFNLGHDNFKRERKFKLRVLEWLTNGKPKLFRSPSEGNYIVRLFDVSLSPNTTVGRMLHSFSSTAYEVADYTYDNLVALGLIANDEIQEAYDGTWKTVDLNKTANGSNLLSNGELIDGFKIVQAFPQDEFTITFGDGTQETIIIGITGNYNVAGVEPIQQIAVGANNMKLGTLTYHSITTNAAESDFDQIKKYEVDNRIKSFTQGELDYAGKSAAEYLVANDNEVLQQVYFIRFEISSNIGTMPKVRINGEEITISGTYTMENPDLTNLAMTNDLVAYCYYRVAILTKEGDSE